MVMLSDSHRTHDRPVPSSETQVPGRSRRSTAPAWAALEMSLACHVKQAEGDKVTMGLPEVKVGLFPGGQRSAYAPGSTWRSSRNADHRQVAVAGQRMNPAHRLAARIS